jgi:hypothetical protein
MLILCLVEEVGAEKDLVRNLLFEGVTVVMFGVVCAEVLIVWY